MLDVELAGICGSDLHGYRGHPGPRVPPLVLGHEVVGRVDGDAYAVYPLIGCGECAHCLAGEDNLCASWRLIGMHRQGVFAERVAVPRALARAAARRDRPRARGARRAARVLRRRARAARRRAVRGRARLRAARAADRLPRAARAGAHVTAVDPLAGAARDRRAARRGRHRRRARRRATSTSSSTPPASRPTWRAALAGVRARRHGRDARARQRRGDVPDGACSSAARSRCAASSPTRAPSSRARSRCSPRATCRSTGSRPRRSPKAPTRSRTSSTGRPSTPKSRLLDAR